MMMVYQGYMEGSEVEIIDIDIVYKVYISIAIIMIFQYIRESVYILLCVLCSLWMIKHQN